MEALKKENGELRHAIHQLSVEKERLEDQLYRAFRKCLNTKKRKIRELQDELAALRDENRGGGQSKKPKRNNNLVILSCSDDDEDDTDVDDAIKYDHGLLLGDEEESNTDKEDDDLGQNGRTYIYSILYNMLSGSKLW